MPVAGISDREARVLSAVQFRAAEPHVAIAALTGLREHQVRYAINGLQVRGILLSRAVLVDVYRLGYTYFTLSFSIQAEKQTTSTRILQAFVDSSNVSFVALLSGEYQYLATICAKRIDEVAELLRRLSLKFGNFILKKSIGVHTAFHSYGRRYLTSKKMDYPILTYGERREYLLSKTEHRILQALSNDAGRSIREISRVVGVPPSTVHSQVQKLYKSGIIKGEFYRVAMRALGALQFKLLIFARGLNPQLPKDLERYCRREPAILRFIECIGEWDYEIDLETFNAEAVHALSQHLFDRFGTELNSITALQDIRHLKFEAFPIAAS